MGVCPTDLYASVQNMEQKGLNSLLDSVLAVRRGVFISIDSLTVKLMQMTVD